MQQRQPSNAFDVQTKLEVFRQHIDMAINGPSVGRRSRRLSRDVRKNEMSNCRQELAASRREEGAQVKGGTVA